MNHERFGVGWRILNEEMSSRFTSETQESTILMIEVSKIIFQKYDPNILLYYLVG
jgi:hypothetical protein